MRKLGVLLLDFGFEIITVGFVLFLLVLIWSAPAEDRSSQLIEVLQTDGYEQIELTGYHYIGCGDDDLYRDGFEAVKNGHPVKGVVCSGPFKGYTTRILK